MNRPHVILNAGMTLDGKIATRTGDSQISGPEDLERVYKIRAEVDAVMVGIGTVLEDDPRLTVHRVSSEKPNPLRVVVDSRARTPLSARVLSADAQTLIAVSESAPRARVEELSKRAAVRAFGARKVDLPALLAHLAERGIKSLLLEGGGTLNWGMVKEGLIDEVRLALKPVLVGGRDAVSLVDGEGFARISEGLGLKLKKYYPLGEDFILEYEVLK